MSSPTPSWLLDLQAGWRDIRVFAILGVICVVGGGLVAASTAPLQSERASWAAAYLVLVAGVAQIALGAGQALFAVSPPTRRIAAAQVAGWNVGNAAVIVGTLFQVLVIADIGALLLLATLIRSLQAVRGTSGGRPGRLYRGLLVVLVVSIPIGLVLARLRPA
jgi:predicted acyltransferase